MHLGNLKALSSALNAKDYYTLGHAARVSAYMVLLGQEFGWPDEFVKQAEEAAYLHDIGKIGVPDRVLVKPAGLNAEEWRRCASTPYGHQPGGPGRRARLPQHRGAAPHAALRLPRARRGEPAAHAPRSRPDTGARRRRRAHSRALT